MNSWLEVDCFQCNTANMLDAGDPNDLTLSDVGEFVCHNCGAWCALDEEGEAIPTTDEPLTDGLPLPVAKKKE